MKKVQEKMDDGDERKDSHALTGSQFKCFIIWSIITIVLLLPLGIGGLICTIKSKKHGDKGEYSCIDVLYCPRNSRGLGAGQVLVKQITRNHFHCHGQDTEVLFDGKQAKICLSKTILSALIVKKQGRREKYSEILGISWGWSKR